MDQSGDASGGVPQPQVGENSPFMSGQPAGPTQSFTENSPASFGAAPSQIAASAPAAGGGGAVAAPGVGAPTASPAGFDGGGGGVSLPAPGQPNVAGNVPDVTGGGGSGGGMGGGSGGGTQPTNSVLNAIQNPSLNSVLNAVGGNLGPLASLGVLGFEAANKPGGIGGGQLPAGAQPGPTAGALVGTARDLQAQGQALSQPLATGTLPPGAQAAVDQVTQEQEAQIRQQFASMGLSGSTMEASAIANARQAAEARGFAIAQQMAQQGLSDLSVSSNIFSELLQSGLQSDQEFQQALTQFAASLAGAGGGGTTIRVGA